MSEETPASPLLRRSRRDRKAANTARPEQGETPVSLGYIDSLQYCLDRKGAHVEKITLMGLSGETFRTFYDPNEPARSPFVVAFNPLRAACSALGYDCDVNSEREVEPAVSALTNTLTRDGAAIVHSAREWVVLTLANGPGDQVKVRFPSGSEGVWSREELAAQWLCEPGLLELGLSGYYYFSVDEKTREPKPKEAALGALRRGIRMLTRKTRVEGCVPGVNAYEELGIILTRKRKDDTQKALDLSRYAAWNTFPMTYLQATRVAAAAYLQSIRPLFEEADAREHLDKAVEKYREVVETLGSFPPLPEHIPEVSVTVEGAQVSLGPETRQAVKDYMRMRRRAARKMRRLHKLELEAVHALRKVIEAVERQKQI